MLTMVIVMLAVSVVLEWIFSKYHVDYRFYSKVLRKKWLYLLVLWFSALSCIAFFIWFLVVSDWCVAVFCALYIGAVDALVPLHRIKSVNRLSYDFMYSVYIKNAPNWENKMNTKKKHNSSKRRIV